MDYKEKYEEELERNNLLSERLAELSAEKPQRHAGFGPAFAEQFRRSQRRLRGSQPDPVGLHRDGQGDSRPARYREKAGGRRRGLHRLTEAGKHPGGNASPRLR